MNFLAIRVGWMKEYKGITQSDYIIGGGKNPEETGRGVEVCNFLTHTDGYVYGNVGVKRDWGGLIELTSPVKDIIEL